jgi:hypothetical protein
MDRRVFPGDTSKAVLLPSSALEEMQDAYQSSAHAIANALAVGTSETRAYATSSTVQQQSVANMTVKVNPFVALKNDSPSVHGLGFNPNLDDQTSTVITGDGLTATCDVTIAAASGSNPRRDLIVFQIQSLDCNLEDNDETTISLKAINPTTGVAVTPEEFKPNVIQRVAIRYVQGTPGASPALPSVPAGWTVLAEIYVSTSASSITTSNIFFALPRDNRGYSLDRAVPFTEQLLPYTDGSGLTLKVAAGNVRIGSTFTAVAAGSVSLTNSTTNYVYVASGALATNTTGFPAQSIPIATVVTSGGNITSITDNRVWHSQPTITSTNFTARGYMDGLNLSNNASDANNDIDIAAGEAKATNTSGVLINSSTMVKRLDASWAVGTNQGGLFSGSKAVSTWYHVFMIEKDSDGTIDFGFDTSIIAANRPAGYTAYRRLGSVQTDGSGNIRGFIQFADLFLWKTPTTDVVGVSFNATSVLQALTVPPDVRVLAKIKAWAHDTSNDEAYALFTTPDCDDIAIISGGSYSNTGFPTFGLETTDTFTAEAMWQGDVLTNTSKQIRYVGSSFTTSLSIDTVGWTDFRGKS